MPIKSIFSRRQKKLRGDYPDVYQYDEIPKKLRNQIVLIIQEHLLQEYSDETNTIFNVIRNLLCKEYGVFYLYRQREDDIDDVLNFFLK